MNMPSDFSKPITSRDAGSRFEEKTTNKDSIN
jgi:hypothetical protein